MLRSANLTHISLILVGLMWVLPFLNYIHEYPITTFYQEWSSALLGVMALTLLVTRDYWDQPEIPRIAQFPAALIGVVLLQWGLGMVAYFDQAMLYILYLLLGGLLMLLGARLRERLGIAKTAMVLAIFLLLGAELSALIGVLQHYRWHTPLDWVISGKVYASVYGNIGQPNHFANYIALGLISLGLLVQQQKLRAGYVVLLAMPLLFVMTLSGSKSSWLYLVMMAGLAGWWARRDPNYRPMLRYCLLLIAGFGIMHMVVQLPFMAGEGSTTDTLQRLIGDKASSGIRLFDDKDSGGIRLFLWRESAMMFMQSPWLGVGFGQFAWQHFQMLPEMPPLGIQGMYHNAHNLIFQIAAEAGIAGLAALLLPLGIWLSGLRRSTFEAAHWWGYAALGVMAIHSLLEYPLWYAHFMAIAAFLLGMLDETRYRLEMRNIGRISVAAILLLGMVTLVQLMGGYRNLEQALAISKESGIKAGASDQFREKLVAIYGKSLLTPNAEVLLTSLIEVNDDRLKEKLEVNTRVMHYAPIGPVVFRQAYLLAQANQLELAKSVMERAIWCFPGSFGPMHKKMTEMAEKDPEHFSALLEFALEKAQEYHRAVYKQ